MRPICGRAPSLSCLSGRRRKYGRGQHRVGARCSTQSRSCRARSEPCRYRARDRTGRAIRRARERGWQRRHRRNRLERGIRARKSADVGPHIHQFGHRYEWRRRADRVGLPGGRTGNMQGHGRDRTGRPHATWTRQSLARQRYIRSSERPRCPRAHPPQCLRAPTARKTEGSARDRDRHDRLGRAHGDDRLQHRPKATHAALARQRSGSERRGRAGLSLGTAFGVIPAREMSS
jgi:hypothetical protein